jgi:hypothetical protein
MPWFVLPERERKRAHETVDRIPGSCHDTIEAVLVHTSALLRRRGSEEVALVAALITNAPHCVPCITLITHLDARPVYVALERLKTEANVRLAVGTCRRCGRQTTVHMIGE